MDISLQIEAVYRRALLLRQYATESPVQQELLEKALKELYFVLEELQTSEEELRHQNRELMATRQAVDIERQRYQALFELAPDGYLVTNLQGKIYHANRAAIRLFSVPREYLINKPLVVLIDASERPLFQARLANIEAVHDWEVSLQPRNGERIYLAIAVNQIKDAQGRDNTLLWSLRDITLRKKMQQQLQSAHNELEQRVKERTVELSQINLRLQQEIEQHQKAEQKIREQSALIDIATDAILVQDLDNRILLWSQGAERLYGWEETAILGKKIDELLYQKTPPLFAVGFQQTLEQGAWQGEFEQVTQAGKTIIVTSRWTLVRDESGQPKSILVVNTDVTAQKKLEIQFYRAQRMESLGSIARGIVHDLNNVFTPILGLAELQLTKRQGMNEQTSQIWQIVVNNAKHGVGLVQQILMFAQGKEGKRIPLQIGTLLIEITKIIQQTFPKYIQISIDIPTQTLWLVSAESTQIQQVVINLCVNARDAMPHHGKLQISAENRHIDAIYAQMQLDAHVGNYVVITIADTGSGMPPLVMERIFEPFFTTKEPDKGSGLGLSTVMNIVKNHGGFMEVSSEVGKGTRFQIFFPAIEGSVNQPVKQENFPSGEGELVMIVDDETSIQEAMKILLENYEYKTLVASDGVEAVKLYTRYKDEIKVVIIDMMMPNIDGLTILPVLKQINSQVVIIAVSGLPSNQEQALSSGAQAFLAKPYRAEEILVTLHNLLHSPTQ
ncbi:PAS domain-containing hybrid sensor histidine kinase/response regulator [Calothrix sp. 336/3]|uniref:PAS domain-containing hybrid sensor histidine kinase/response regulator n=1 Tax=Calothrix sp. 336/3 TaxID=1337936 RepID=UPI00069A50F4|nr:PAS domain S-box protein [Calothrix sp. 336/3]